MLHGFDFVAARHCCSVDHDRSDTSRDVRFAKSGATDDSKKPNPTAEQKSAPKTKTNESVLVETKKAYRGKLSVYQLRLFEPMQMHHDHFLQIIVALCPPKPKLLFIA